MIEITFLSPCSPLGIEPEEGAQYVGAAPSVAQMEYSAERTARWARNIYNEAYTLPYPVKNENTPLTRCHQPNESYRKRHE